MIILVASNTKPMKLFFTFFLLTSVLVFSAQNATITGKVSDLKTNEPLVGAGVILNTGGGARVDFDGNYKLSVAAGEYKLSFKFIGYETEEKQITVTAGEEVVIDIQLSSGNMLNDFVKSASKFDQKIGEVPVSMTVIKPDLINNKATVSPESIVDQCPGVQVLENQVSIRGGSGFSYGSGSRVLLMVDDLPMLSADAGDIKWTSLPLENTEQMEIIKGASSVLYGSSALNGIINIRTAYPRSEPRTVINISNGIFLNPTGTQMGNTLPDENGNISDSIIDRSVQAWNPNTNYYVTGNFFHSRKVNENMDMVVGGNFLTDQGYRQGEWENRGRLNTNLRWRSKKIDGLAYGVNANHNNAKGALFFLWQNADSVFIPQGGVDTATTTLSEYRTFRTNIDPFITYYDSSGNKHSLRTRFFNTTNQNSTAQGSIANLYYAEYQYQKAWKNDFTGTFGVMNNYSTVDSELYGDHFANNSAVFAQLNKKYKKFTFVGGVRAEMYKIDTVKTVVQSKYLNTTLPFKPVFRIGSTYELAKYTYLRASYGEGYRFPTIAEKYIKTNVGGLNIFPNPLVEPETGYSAEIGIKQGFRIGNFQGYLDLAGFYTGYRDMMEFTFGFFNDNGTPWDYGPDGTNYPSFGQFGAQSQNIEDAIIKGGEISVMGTGKIGEVNVSILAGYTYIDPKSTIDLDNPSERDSVYLTTFSDTAGILKYRSKHLAKIDLQLDYKKFAIGFSSRYNSFQQNVDETFVSPLLGNIILPGYADYRNARRTGDLVFDARASFNITEESKLSILMNNVTNREYSTRPGNVMPPRTLIFQYSVKF
ncbi:MAG: outer membrane receptor protein involved in Fe transport [Parvicella sp.]